MFYVCLFINKCFLKHFGNPQILFCQKKSTDSKLRLTSEALTYQQEQGDTFRGQKQESDTTGGSAHTVHLISLLQLPNQHFSQQLCLLALLGLLPRRGKRACVPE